MSKTITGRFVNAGPYRASHMAYLLETDKGLEMTLIDDDSDGRSIRPEVRERWMDQGRIKEMISIPVGTIVTILGPPEGQNTMETPWGHDLIMRVRATEALVWNSANRHWYCEHSVETVIRMTNFDGNMDR
mgnify:FL=1